MIKLYIYQENIRINNWIVYSSILFLLMRSRRFEKSNTWSGFYVWTDDKFSSLWRFQALNLLAVASLNVFSLFNIPPLYENRKCAPKQVHVHQRTRVLRTLCMRVRALNCGFESISLNLANATVNNGIFIYIYLSFSHKLLMNLLYKN